MSRALKFITLGVAVIVVAILVVIVVSLMNSGKNLVDQGTASLNNSTKAFADIDKTQYEEATISGTQVVELIKQYWKPDSTTAICVCTKDHTNIMYDYNGGTYEIKDSLSGFPSSDAANQSNYLSGVLRCSEQKGYAGVDVHDSNTGYKCSDPGKAGYINKTSGIFRGKVQYDTNDNIRCITFVQQ